MWIWLSISHFSLNILILFRHRFQTCRGPLAARRGARRARGAERRAERGAKRRTEPRTEPRGPGGLLAVPPTTLGKLETDGESQQKKILSTQPRKKNTHQQTKLLIQRKHLYAYDMTFLCPPPTPPTKKYRRCKYTFDNSGIHKRNMYLMRILY